MVERPVPEALAHLDLASIADVGARQGGAEGPGGGDE